MRAVLEMCDVSGDFWFYRYIRRGLDGFWGFIRGYSGGFGVFFCQWAPAISARCSQLKTVSWEKIFENS